jgi:hypothetical protein
MTTEARPNGDLARFRRRLLLAPSTLKLFAVLFVLAELVALVISPSALRGFGVLLAIGASVGVLAAIWVVWFGVGIILLISLVVGSVGGHPWYEVAWPVLALTLLCWPTSWTFINSGAGSP